MTVLSWLAGNWTEVLGFGTGALCVFLAARRNIWNFPIGIANNVVDRHDHPVRGAGGGARHAVGVGVRPRAQGDPRGRPHRAVAGRGDEFDLIVDRQIQLEDEALRRVPRPLLNCDTDVLATAVWHERYVGPGAERIFERAAAHRPALYILTGDEVPFVQDGMRDGEHIRHEMHERFREVLEAQSVPWIEVRGSGAERMEAARAVIEPMTATR